MIDCNHTKGMTGSSSEHKIVCSTCGKELTDEEVKKVHELWKKWEEATR